MADRKFAKNFIYYENWYIGFFWVADYKFEVSFVKFNMMHPIDRKKEKLHHAVACAGSPLISSPTELYCVGYRLL